MRPSPSHAHGLRRRTLMALLPAVLAACASRAPRAPRVSLPMLRLSPAAAGLTLAAVQRLSVRRLDGAGVVSNAPSVQTVDLLLSLGAQRLRLAGFSLGQRVLTLDWDGSTLDVKRHPLLPAEVDTDRMLRDLCLVYWPADAVRASLPAGWTLEHDGAGRRLLKADRIVIDIRYTGALDAASNQVELTNRAESYSLSIESQLQSP